MRAFALSFVVFFIPFFASAASPLEGSIVPACSYGPFEGACGFCDIFQLAQNLINFAVAFSVLVATIMFVYAGFLYFSASAKHDNIKKAHGIFWKVFIGFVFILGAWLIVSLIMSTLLDDRFSPWNGFAECGVSSSVQRSPSAPTGGITTVPSPTTDSGESVDQQILDDINSLSPESVQALYNRFCVTGTSEYTSEKVTYCNALQARIQETKPSWCLEVDGETQCFATISGCTLAYGVAERSGSSVSECSSQSQESPEDASVPQETSDDKQTTEPDNPSKTI